MMAGSMMEVIANDRLGRKGASLFLSIVCHIRLVVLVLLELLIHLSKLL